MRNSPSSESSVLSNQSGKGTRNPLSVIETSKPLVASASIILAPSALLSFIAMVGPSYFLAKIFELAGRDSVKYPGQLNSYVKDQSQFAGAVTGIVEYFAKKGVDQFKNFVSVINECIPAGERFEITPEEVEKLHKGVLCYNDKGEMEPAPTVASFNFENLLAQNQNNTQITQLRF